MARECSMCEYHRNKVWYFEDLEFSVDACTLGYTNDADECADFEELEFTEIDYDYIESGGNISIGSELFRLGLEDYPKWRKDENNS